MLIRGSILNPLADGSVEYWPDAILESDERGQITSLRRAEESCQVARSVGVICPAFFDNHIHIPQHPIRGEFVDGINENPPGGRLLAGLNRNVFPAESRCSDDDYTSAIVDEFLADTLMHGTIGGAAFMTVHPSAARIALSRLPATWQVGPVLMNQNCPEYLRTPPDWLQHFEELGRDFSRRMIVTDRFAVAVDSSLRQRAVMLAENLGLRMQTHLNEQLAEKKLVEQTLYPHQRDYTSVYAGDGLLRCEPILAHCIWMSDREWELLAKHEVTVAHCPISNLLLGSGVMQLDKLLSYGIEYSICTDVGASPSTSLLVESAIFLAVHRGRSRRATPSEALSRITLSAAERIGLDDRYGSFEPGKSMTFVELNLARALPEHPKADDVIAAILDPPHMNEQWLNARDSLAAGGLQIGSELDLLARSVEQASARLDKAVRRLVVDGRETYLRQA